MEELAKEEQLRKKRERNDRLGIWSLDRQRAYPEFDFVRTGELSIQIKDEYVGGLRRNWADGKRQKLESLVDDIASGILAYLAGVKASREEHERRQREWERRQRLAALARAREEREVKRSDFLKRLVAISREADELKLFLARLQEGLCSTIKMVYFAEMRLMSIAILSMSSCPMPAMGSLSNIISGSSASVVAISSARLRP
jgi:hypothetical protein